jgi:hypothetical protein
VFAPAPLKPPAWRLARWDETPEPHGAAFTISATPLMLCRITLWSFLALLVTTTAADADLWGHLRFGLDMLASKTLPTADPYSFTSDRIWINHEWLSELLMGAAYRPFGSAGLGLLKLTIIAIVFATLLAVARLEHARPAARDLFIALALFATYSRTQVVRPQLFSVALFGIILYLLRLSDRGQDKVLRWLPVIFAVWANVHGAWIVGLAAVGVWLAGDFCQRPSAARFWNYLTIGALSGLATLLNPYGLGLWQFIAETVRPARPDITDWKPLLEFPTAVLVVESILPIVAIGALWRSRREWRVPPRDLAVLTLLAVATYRVGRVDAFLQAAIAFLLARPLVHLLERIELNARPSLRRASAPVGLMSGALIAYVAWAAIGNVRVVRVEGSWIPDRDAALALRQARPGARVLTWFDWGEYALWQLSPAGIRVSMDGRRETVYSETVTADHMRFYAGREDMVDYPDRIGADHVWLPSHMPIIDPLVRQGWVKVLDTGKSVVLARDGRPIKAITAQASAGNLFPWP